MRNFTRKQIKDFEKVRKETIKKLELFELLDVGVKFTEGQYLCTELNHFNTKWLKELKSAINNINLKNERICGIEIKNNRSKTVKALKKYKSGINAVINHRFKGNKKVQKQIDDIILKELKRQIENLLQNSINGLESNIKTSYFSYGEYFDELMN